MRTDDEVTAASEVCAVTWTAAVDHRHKCRHPDGHPGRHVCACRSWQEGRTPNEATDVEQMRISNRAWADALRERDEALAAVERVRALVKEWDQGPDYDLDPYADRLIDAIHAALGERP